MKKTTRPLPHPYEAYIERLSHEGRGMATLEGKKKFLHGGLPHEKVIAKDQRHHASYDEGHVIEVLTPAPERSTPKCSHYAVCGGCTLQHLHPTHQVSFKESVLLSQLFHIGNITPRKILPPVTGPIWNYRHKARLGVKYVAAKQKVLVGFHERNGHYVADLEKCIVLHPSLGEKISALKEMVYRLEAYQSIPQIEAAVGEGDPPTALVIRHLLPLSEKDQHTLIQWGQAHDAAIYLQPAGPQSIHRIGPITGPEKLHYSLPEQNLLFRFSPTHFTQINVEMNRSMVQLALALLAPQPTETLLDLFCGLGNFTLPLANHCQTVIGIEGEKNLIEQAEENARLNGIHNALFHTADLTHSLLKLPFLPKKIDSVLLDPPRTGALTTVQSLPHFNPKKIVYVSCNPATLARDAHELVQKGYTLTHAGVLDMFPHTSHVESIALFESL